MKRNMNFIFSDMSFMRDKEPQPILIGDDRLALSDSDNDEYTNNSSSHPSPVCALNINTSLFDPTESIRPHALAHAELGFSENIGRVLKSSEREKVDVNKLYQQELKSNRGLKESIQMKGSAKLNYDYRKNQYSNLVSLDVKDSIMLKAPTSRIGEIPSSSRSNQSQTSTIIEPNILEFFTDDLQTETPCLPNYNKVKFEAEAIEVDTIDDISSRMRYHDTISILQQ